MARAAKTARRLTVGMAALGGALCGCTSAAPAASKSVVKYDDTTARPACDASREMEIALTASTGELALCSSGTWLPVTRGGATGATGASGTSGATGATGATGAGGTNGATGATGASGTSGATGATGATGASGTSGATGATGATGAGGTSGATGATGSSTRVVVSTEPAGTNCTNGGYKVVFYVDANGNNTLDGEEQSSTQTAYACNALTAAQLELRATTASMAGDGLNNCGPSGDDVCARSLAVTGGTFNRGTGTSYPATVSDFRLDKYEVTVGRFRKFVDAWVGGWRPSAGAGKHTHVNGGAGLENTAGGNEPGWDATWTAYVGAPSASAVTPSGAGATTKANWNTILSCGGGYQAWTSAAGTNEKRPQNCLSWYDLHAFCIWDGGGLPSEAEWEYAAAGGREERTFPWGNTAPSSNTDLAIHGCYYNGSGSCSGVTNIAPVGTVTAAASKYGQLDLAGNVWEWNLDWYQSPFVAPCSNCTNLAPSSTRVIRGGSFDFDASVLPATNRDDDLPALRNYDSGGRCARTP